ncbi:MAG: glycosyltransferase [Chitinophagaceae bacterium]
MNTTNTSANGRKILFANFPADGHFNPLTGLAVHLATLGYDVRWYTSSGFAKKLKQLKIHHYPFKKAIDVSDGDFDKVFPGREKQKTAIGKLKFDIINAFVLRAPEYYQDIAEVYKSFPFDLLVADCAFTGIPFVKERMHIPVVSIGVLPLTETSADLPPSGLGIAPSYSLVGKMKQAFLRWFADNIIFKQPNKVLHQLLQEYAIQNGGESIFDMLIQKSDLLLQSGTPGFEYKRQKMSSHIHFIGPLLPFASAKQHSQWFDTRINRYKRVVLLTQGTVEKDINKIIVPALEAFKKTETLVICTTGGSQTAKLRNLYPYDNIIIEDFIPFHDVMPYADAYITNGGYGGVMMGIENNLPLVVAGIHEGKNEICARVGYFKLGINLKTEKPLPTQLADAVNEVISNPLYKQNVRKLSKEFDAYQPTELCARYIAQLLGTIKPGRANTILKLKTALN